MYIYGQLVTVPKSEGYVDEKATVHHGLVVISNVVLFLQFGQFFLSLGNFSLLCGSVLSGRHMEKDWARQSMVSLWIQNRIIRFRRTNRRCISPVNESHSSAQGHFLPKRDRKGVSNLARRSK